MSFYVYILKSNPTGRFYCGYSSDPARRLAQHNDPEYCLSKTTKRFKGPCKLVHSIECPQRREAMRLGKVSALPDRTAALQLLAAFCRSIL